MRHLTSRLDQISKRGYRKQINVLYLFRELLTVALYSLETTGGRVFPAKDCDGGILSPITFSGATLDLFVYPFSFPSPPS